MSQNIKWQNHTITKLQRAAIKHQKPCILWLTGLSGSGKSTLANAIEAQLFKHNKHTFLLDGDNIRFGLNKDLGFDKESRIENIRRIGEASKLFVESGLIVITAFISPFLRDRQIVRELVEDGEFIEIYVNTPLEVCENRDSKGLYKKARNNEILEFTGISSPYEIPLNPEIILENSNTSVEDNVEIVIQYLIKHGFITK